MVTLEGKAYGSVVLDPKNCSAVMMWFPFVTLFDGKMLLVCRHAGTWEMLSSQECWYHSLANSVNCNTCKSWLSDPG